MLSSIREYQEVFILNIILRGENRLFGGFFFYTDKTLATVAVAMLDDLASIGTIVCRDAAK